MFNIGGNSFGPQGLPVDSEDKISRKEIELDNSVTASEVEAKEDKELKKNITSILTGRSDFQSKSEALWKVIDSKLPHHTHALKAITEKHAGILDKLKAKTWLKLKATAEDGNIKAQREDMTNFRDEIVEQMTTTCLGLLKEMGYDPPGEFSATGTVGWNSDIDTVFIAPNDMPLEIQVLTKTMFDLISHEALGGLPGPILDTESYVNHPGALLATEEKLSQSPKNQGELLKIEWTAIALQTLVQVGGDVKSSQWEKFKESTPDDWALTICKDAEEFITRIDNEITSAMFDQKGIDTSSISPKEQMDIKGELTNDGSYQLARLSYKMSALQKISQKIDTVTHSIKEKEKEILEKRNINHPVDDLQSERDTLELKRAHLFTFVKFFEDEGYLTQGAFNKVCLKNEGQIHQSIVKKYKDERMQQQLNTLPLNLQLRRKSSFSLGVRQRRSASQLERLSSMLENHAMYQGHFKENMDHLNQSATQSLVTVSKYSHRILSSGLDLIRTFTESKKFNALQPRVKKKFQKQIEILASAKERAGELEAVKRGKVISMNMTKHLLLERLNEMHPGKNEIVSRIDRLIDGVQDLEFEESVTPRDQYIQWMSKIIGLELAGPPESIQPGELLTCDDPEINAIIKARLGLETEQPEVKNYINNSKEFTIRNYKTEESVNDFNKELNIIIQNTQTLAIDYGAIDRPDPSQGFNLLESWSQAIS
ncbi:MAG: hypothetical protein WD595_06555 [Waddliaceae bacterium]